MNASSGRPSFFFKGKGKMKKIQTAIWMALSLGALSPIARAQTPSSPTVPVTIDNYNRAQSDVYFALIAKSGGFGKFRHGRDLAAIGRGGIIRPNRDTLYSLAVFDLDAGPVTITLPDPDKHFMTMQIINEDQYTQPVYHGAGSHTLTREMIGTRYAGVAVRVLVDPRDKNDLQEIHSFQDAIKVTQQNPGTFQVPNWDEANRKKVQAALLQLGTTIYRLTVRDVPVDGFWSATVYNGEGYIEPNQYATYSVNSYTAVKGPDGSVTVQFGGCDGKTPNCLPIIKGWNYTVRLFRPRLEILDGRWKVPLAAPKN